MTRATTREAGYERALPYLLVAPTVAVLVALSIYPLVYAVRVSLQTGAGERARWSLQNFSRLASDQFFLDASRTRSSSRRPR